MEQKKLPKLTKKQRGFVNDYVLTENGTQSVLKHYDIVSDKPEKVASVIATENLAKPSIINAIEVKRETLKSALEKEGITPIYVAQKVKVLLTAVDEKGNDDYTAIDKGLKHATNIYGVEDLDKPKENVYNFFFEPKFQQNIRSYDENFKNQLLNKDVEEDKTV
jgi:Terminase small subunit